MHAIKLIIRGCKIVFLFILLLTKKDRKNVGNIVNILCIIYLIYFAK